MFRFTIRELVLLTIVVAMGVGWWLDRSSYRHPWLRFRNLTEQDRWAVEVFTRAAVAEARDHDLSLCRDSKNKISVKDGTNWRRYEFPEMPPFR